MKKKVLMTMGQINAIVCDQLKKVKRRGGETTPVEARTVALLANAAVAVHMADPSGKAVVAYEEDLVD
jgi:hypothetical protein